MNSTEEAKQILKDWKINLTLPQYESFVTLLAIDIDNGIYKRLLTFSNKVKFSSYADYVHTCQLVIQTKGLELLRKDQL